MENKGWIHGNPAKGLPNNIKQWAQREIREKTHSTHPNYSNTNILVNTRENNVDTKNSINSKVGTTGVVNYKVGTKLQSRNQWGCIQCVPRGFLQWFRLCYITRFTRFTRFTPPSVFLDFSFKYTPGCGLF